MLWPHQETTGKSTFSAIFNPKKHLNNTIFKKSILSSNNKSRVQYCKKEN